MLDLTSDRPIGVGRLLSRGLDLPNATGVPTAPITVILNRRGR